MLALHDLDIRPEVPEPKALNVPHTLKLETPPLWFWMKAGLGLAIGWGILFTVFWFALLLLTGGIWGALLGLRPH